MGCLSLGSIAMLSLDDVDEYLYNNVCGSKTISLKLQYLVKQNTEMDYPNINDRIDAVAWDYADHSMDIWTEDTGVYPEDFWQKNYYWAIDILNTLLDKHEEQYIAG